MRLHKLALAELLLMPLSEYWDWVKDADEIIKARR